LMADVVGTNLPEAAREAIARGAVSETILLGEIGTRRLSLAMIGRTGDDELLFRLMSDDVGGEEAILKRRFAVTSREAEVLLWVARGKSNRDIGD
ncbi:hypothetical protein ABTL63_19115, partial [Acinetobacter baumannii]